MIRHTGEGRCPVVLFNMELGFVLAKQGANLNDWIPAFAGITNL